MHRNDLVTLLTALDNGTVAVFPNGTLIDTDTVEEYQPADIRAAVAELTAELDALLKWAESAPQRERAETPAE